MGFSLIQSGRDEKIKKGAIAPFPFNDAKNTSNITNRQIQPFLPAICAASVRFFAPSLWMISEM